MRFRPSSFIIICLFRSMFTLGFCRGGSVVDVCVCWVASLHDRLHISHTSVSPVLTYVQNWQIHWGRDPKESGPKRCHAERGDEATHTCLCVLAQGDLRWETSGATGGRVARRGRSHTSQRMLLPWFMTVQLLHCHSDTSKYHSMLNLRSRPVSPLFLPHLC